MVELPGANALLTGAAGGLGRYIARALAEQGANLVLLDRPGVSLQDLLEELRAHRVEVEVLQLDLTDRSRLRTVIREAEGALGPLDVLVNNAGVEFGGPFLHQTAEELETIAAVNLIAVMELSRQALPGMLERRRGHIVNMASLAGKAPFPYLVSYSATKFGVVGFTHALRAEIGDEPVGASAICPGLVRDVGMFGRIEDRVGDVPPELGTIKPEHVSEAVVRAIRENRAEMIVNSQPSRPLAALAVIAPKLTASLMRRRRRLIDFAHGYAAARGRL